MANKATVTYFHHSGFSVAVGATLLVFDYWQGEHGELTGGLKLQNSDLQDYERIIFFVSHSHPDHFDPVIYTFDKELPITYVVSSEMPIGTRGKRLGEGESLAIGEAKITAFGSTDLGVSYLVHLGGLSVFHAGDLNLWHWREESTLREINEAERAYYAAAAPLSREHIDIAMFPVDPRMGSFFDAGANHFILSVKPRLMIPMHWQNRPEVAVDFARHARNKHTEVLALTKPRERAELLFEPGELDIHIFTPMAAPGGGTPKETAAAPAADVSLDAYAGNDPFSDTDLPVELE